MSSNADSLISVVGKSTIENIELLECKKNPTQKFEWDPLMIITG